ncbi:hypothetical protein VB711_23270 [Cronbergia sp. UHCC 0137]|uniref:hypothetical protein n=1 Tax=Cronbergia sp. UHCC 0137 TaxID=3110239 RepID=UPI002B202020|nr:hypothetical protein [Cronbergia sp. UHCC 0137]MEA5620738.1 hypothetical protein [Cronbergia sp. UHCC 0137]
MKLYLVVIGSLIVGTFACIKYINNNNKNKRIRKAKYVAENKVSQISPQKQKDTRPVTLCIIVPALALENVRKNYPIDSEYIKELIDNSLYFLCTDDTYEAKKISELLETTDEDYINVSEQREVYVSIEIDNAEEMIRKKVPYILKRNLPANAKGVVRQLACLKYLSVSGLEKFNRI